MSEQTSCRQTSWVENWFRPTVVAGMMACIVGAVVALGQRIVPAWHGSYLTAFTFIVAWEAIQSERYIRRAGSGMINRFRFRLAELVVILTVLRFAPYAVRGLDVLRADVLQWWRDPPSLFDLGFLYGGLMLVMAWQTALFVTRDLYELELHPADVAPPSTSTQWDLWVTQPRSSAYRQEALNRITEQFLWGGIVLLICTGLTQSNVLALRGGPPRLSALMLNAFAYILGGLIVISQARFTILRVEWQLDGIPFPRNIASRWTVMAIVSLCLIAAIAFSLPSGYSLGLPQALSTLLDIVVYIVMFLVEVLFFLFILALSLLLRLLGLQPLPISAHQPRLSAMPTPMPSPSSQGGISWFGLLRDLVFWALIVGSIGYSLYTFLRDRRGLFARLGQVGLIGWLLNWLGRAFARTRGWAEQARASIGEQLRRRLRPKEGPSWRFVRLSALAPRDLVRYFYLSIVRRAARQRGLARTTAQTPYEYSAGLRARMPDADAEIAELTEGFVVARYSRQEITRQDTGRLKAAWKRVRASLREKLRDN